MAGDCKRVTPNDIKESTMKLAGAIDSGDFLAMGVAGLECLATVMLDLNRIANALDEIAMNTQPGPR